MGMAKYYEDNTEIIIERLNSYQKKFNSEHRKNECQLVTKKDPIEYNRPSMEKSTYRLTFTSTRGRRSKK